MKWLKKNGRFSNRLEEYLNIFSHGLGILLGLAAIIFVYLDTTSHHPKIFLSCLLCMVVL